MNETRCLIACLLTAALLAIPARFTAAAEKIPIIHSTDLFHPPDDPDDHYDLASLFALQEFDVKGIVLDLGERQAKRSGTPAVEQMIHITGHKCPYAIGLDRPLRSRIDKALDEPPQFQGGIELVISILRKSPEKVVIHTAGSCRDVAAAFNREPALFKEKVRAVYLNVGSGPNEPQSDYNVGLDVQGYLRMFESGLPVYWCPCFGKNGFQTVYVVDQPTLLGACTRQVQNYFVYCLTNSKEDPIAFLNSGPHMLPTGDRGMYCTGPLFHAAGRRIYQRGSDDFIALPPAEAEKLGLAHKVVRAFDFVPMRARVEDGGAVSKATIPQAKPGHLAAAYLGEIEGRVGAARPEPHGRTDCRVQIVGVEPDRPIKNIVLTGPNEGRWELIETGRWWRLVYERHARQLDCYFQFYAPGEHEAQILYANGTKQSVRFSVPAAGPWLKVALDPSDPNGSVFRSTDPRYKQIMASCIRNLLAGLQPFTPQ
jgi:hypothetical protein